MTSIDDSETPRDEPVEAAPRRLGWSFRVGRLFGIAIYVHATLVLLLGFIAAASLMQGEGIAGAASGLAMAVALFATIALHELSHALTARRFGVGTHDITLLPIGGVSSLERMPEKPWQEAVVSLAGPALNVALGLLFAGVIVAAGDTFSNGFDMTQGSFLTKLFWMNASLAVFNLIPAFPMDGGRVLRAALTGRFGASRATEVAARTGQLLALVFGFVGLFFNPILLLIAVFVWMGAQQELQASRVKAALRDVSVRAATMTHLESLRPDEPLSRAVALLLDGYQQDFPVVEDGRPVGVLTRDDLVNALAKGGADQPVDSAMHRRFATANAGERLDAVLERLDDAPIVVREAGRMLGLLTRENLADLLMTREAMRTARS